MLIIILFILFLLILILILIYNTKIENCFSYKGSIIHTRFATKQTKENTFKYNITMDYFNINTPPSGKLLSHDSNFYLIKNKQQIEKIINKKIDEVYLLTNIKYFFICFNPISLYFCYNNNNLINIIAEVSNIPWFDKTLYIIDIENNNIINFTCDKNMHVSPFNPHNNQQYVFNIKKSDNNIFVSINVMENNNKILIAYMNLYKDKFIKFRNHRTIFTIIQIYYQAFLLYCKKFKLYNYPYNN